MELIVTFRWMRYGVVQSVCRPIRTVYYSITEPRYTLQHLVNLLPRVPGLGHVWADTYEFQSWWGFWCGRREDGSLAIQWRGFELNIVPWEVMKKSWHTMNSLHHQGIVKAGDIPAEPESRFGSSDDEQQAAAA